MDFILSIMGEILLPIILVPLEWMGVVLIWIVLNIFGYRISIENVHDRYGFLSVFLGVIMLVALVIFSL